PPRRARWSASCASCRFTSLPIVLHVRGEVQPAFPGGVAAGALHAGGVGVGVQGGAAAGAVPAQRGAAADPLAGGFEVADVVAQGCVDAADVSGELVRSEEHTSELQSREN